MPPKPLASPVTGGIPVDVAYGLLGIAMAVLGTAWFLLLSWMARAGLRAAEERARQRAVAGPEDADDPDADAPGREGEAA